MLIEDYTVEVFTPPCDPTSESYSAIASLDSDIGEVLPFLNAILDHAVYHSQSPWLTWRMEHHHITLQAREIAISNVEDREMAMREIANVVDLLNRTWSRRGEIKPDFDSHQRAKPLEVYALLPGGNCRRCGESTCYNFALKLVVRQRGIAECPSLMEPGNAERALSLRALIGNSPT